MSASSFEQEKSGFSCDCTYEVTEISSDSLDKTRGWISPVAVNLVFRPEAGASPDALTTGLTSLLAAYDAKVNENASVASHNERVTYGSDRNGKIEKFPKPYLQVTHIKISGFENLSFQAQVDALRQLCEFVSKKVKEREHFPLFQRDPIFEIEFVRAGELEEKQALDASFAERPEQLAARECLCVLQGQEKKSDFETVIKKWLFPQVNSVTKTLSYNEGHLSIYQNHGQLAIEYCQELMGSSLLKAVLEYLSEKRPPRDSLVSLFDYKGQGYSNFEQDLKALAECAYFPFDLRLPGHGDSQYSLAPYSEAEFTHLLALLKTAKTKGISRIDFSHSIFTDQQLQAILALIKECNEQDIPCCELLNISPQRRDEKEVPQERSGVLEAIKKEQAQNFRKRRILDVSKALLGHEFAAIAVDEKEKPGIQEEKGVLVAPGREAKKIKAFVPRDPALEMLLSDFLEEMSGSSLGVHVQLQQQQQVQQAEEVEQVLERRVHAEGVEAWDGKEIIGYAEWISPQYRAKLLEKLRGPSFKPKHFTADTASLERVWLSWVEHGLKFVSSQGLDGFRPEAIDRLLELLPYSQEGFDFEALPAGFQVRRIEKEGRVLQVLFYDSALAPVPGLLGATHWSGPPQHRDMPEIRPTRFMSFVGASDSTYQDLFKLIRWDHCLQKNYQESTHDACPCLACTLTPRDAKQSLDEKTTKTFIAKEHLTELLGASLQKPEELWSSAGLQNTLVKLQDALKKSQDEWGRGGDIKRALDGLRVAWEPVNYSSAWHKPMQEIVFKYRVKLLYSLTGLQLPEAEVIQGDFLSWEQLQLPKLNQVIQDLRDGKILLEAPEALVTEMWNELRKFVRTYEASLVPSRAAFYQLLWGETEAAVNARFPVLENCSLRHLHLLLKIAYSLDLNEEEYKATAWLKPPHPKVIEMLLNKLGEIAQLDGNPQTFDLLLKYALNPSDDWLITLMESKDDSALNALSGLCTFSREDRANWNWLVERHGQRYGYVDLGRAWEKFQAYNASYRKRVGADHAPLDFRQFPPESAQNLDHFLNFLIAVLNNSRDPQEQMQLLRDERPSIDKKGAYLASQYQSFYLICKEMELGSQSAQVRAADQEIKAVMQSAPRTEADIKKEKDELRYTGITTRETAEAQRVAAAFKEQKAIDYSVTRAELLAAASQESKQPSLTQTTQIKGADLSFRAALFRFFGGQPQAVITAANLRSCCEKFPQSLPLLALIAVTTTHQRAAALQEREKFPAAYQQLLAATPLSPELEGFIMALLQLHSRDDFAPLTFVEAVTLIRYWQATAPSKRREFSGNLQQILGNPLYRDPFLRVLREVDVSLPFSDYLQYIKDLMARAAEQKSQNDPEYCDQLCWLVSRIASNPSNAAGQWQSILTALKTLGGQQTAEGVPLAKRLVLMLSQLPPGSISLGQLNGLLNGASQLNPPLQDEALFAWLKNSGFHPSLGHLTYPGLRTELPATASQAISKALEESKVPLNLRRDADLVLKSLWDPMKRLGALNEADAAVFNRLATQQATAFLKTLLSKTAVWQRQSTELLKFLAQQPRLNHYNFEFLTDLFTALSSLKAIDSDLSLIKQLLDPGRSESAIRALCVSQDLCPSLQKICALPLGTVGLGERERMVHLLLRHCLTAQDQQQAALGLSLRETTDSLIDLSSRYSPAVCHDLLSVLESVSTAQQEAFVPTLQYLQALARPQVLEEKKGEAPGLLPAAFANLLRALAGHSRLKGAAVISGAEKAEILAYCANPESDRRIVDILASTSGPKDGSNIKQLLEILKALPQAELAELHRLCQHPPKLKISKTLLPVLTSPEGRLARLRALELDPYAHIPSIKRLAQPNLFESEAKLRQQIAEIKDASSSADGREQALSRAEQDSLVLMLTKINAWTNTEAHYPNQAGQLCTARQLSTADIQRLMRGYRRALSVQGVSNQQRQETLLEAIPLIRESIYRATGKCLNSTQVLAICSMMVTSPLDTCFANIQTGEGKTVVNLANAACSWLLMPMVMVLTSDSGLAARDANQNRPAFALMGIPTAAKAITQTSHLADYCQDGVNYSTAAGFELSIDHIHLSEDASALPFDQMAMNYDEVDDPRDDRTDYRNTVPLVQSENEHESPLSVYYLAMANAFLESPDYLALQKDKTKKLGDACGLLYQFLMNPPLPYSPTPQQQEALQKLLEANPKQLRLWLASIHRADAMREGRDYALYTSTVLINGEMREIKRVVPYTAAKRANPEAQFSRGVQQFLQAKRQVIEQDPQYLVAPESAVLLTSSAQATQDPRRYGCFKGNSGSVASQREASLSLIPAGVRLRKFPRHKKSTRNDVVQYYNGPEAHINAVCAQMAAIAKQRPGAAFLIITSDAERLNTVSPAINAQLERLVVAKAQSITGSESGSEEGERVKAAGKRGACTIATSLAGRGFDIQPEEELVVICIDPPPNQRIWDQWRGRTDRPLSGAQEGEEKAKEVKSETYTIIDRTAMKSKGGRPVNTLEDLFAANEVYDFCETASKSYSVNVTARIKSNFLALHESLRGLPVQGKLLDHFRQVHIGLLEDLEDNWTRFKDAASHEMDEKKSIDPKTYSAQLKAKQAVFFGDASRRWNAILTTLQADLGKFEKDQALKHKTAQIGYQQEIAKAGAAAAKLRTAMATPGPAAPAEAEAKAGAKPTLAEDLEKLEAGMAATKRAAEEENQAWQALSTQCVALRTRIQASFLTPEQLEAVMLVQKQAPASVSAPAAASTSGQQRPENENAIAAGNLSTSTTPDSASFSKPTKKGFFSRHKYELGLLLAVFCLGGAAFTVTGLAAGLSLPFVGGFGWSLASGLSFAATLANPGFWALFGIGLVYGVLALLAVSALVGIGLLIKNSFAKAPPSSGGGGLILERDPVKSSSPELQQAAREDKLPVQKQGAATVSQTNPPVLKT